MKETDPIFLNAHLVVLLDEEDGAKAGEIAAMPCNSYVPLEVFASDKTMFYVIGGLFRPGVAEFAARLEHEHYRPGTDRNCKYRLIIANWPLDERKMHWYVIGFPVEDRATAEALAKECGLRFADGFPCILSDGQPSFFPMGSPDNENVWNLENIEGWTPANWKEKLKKEQERVAKVVEDSIDLQHGKVNVDL